VGKVREAAAAVQMRRYNLRLTIFAVRDEAVWEPHVAWNCGRREQNSDVTLARTKTEHADPTFHVNVWWNELNDHFTVLKNLHIWHDTPPHTTLRLQQTSIEYCSTDPPAGEKQRQHIIQQARATPLARTEMPEVPGRSRPSASDNSLSPAPRLYDGYANLLE
jgi:hypothetical protein